MSDQSPKLRKGGCGKFLMVAVLLFLVWAVIFTIQAPNRTAYQTCKVKAMEDDPYADSYSSFSQSTITRSGDIYIVQFTKYGHAYVGDLKIIDDLKCFVNNKDGDWRVTDMILVQERRE